MLLIPLNYATWSLMKIFAHWMAKWSTITLSKYLLNYESAQDNVIDQQLHCVYFCSSNVSPAPTSVLAINRLTNPFDRPVHIAAIVQIAIPKPTMRNIERIEHWTQVMVHFL